MRSDPRRHQPGGRKAEKQSERERPGEPFRGGPQPALVAGDRLELVDLVVHGAKCRGVGGAEVFTAGDGRDLLQQIHVEIAVAEGEPEQGLLLGARPLRS